MAKSVQMMRSAWRCHYKGGLGTRGQSWDAAFSLLLYARRYLRRYGTRR